ARMSCPPMSPWVRRYRRGGPAGWGFLALSKTGCFRGASPRPPAPAAPRSGGPRPGGAPPPSPPPGPRRPPARAPRTLFGLRRLELVWHIRPGRSGWHRGAAFSPRLRRGSDDWAHGGVAARADPGVPRAIVRYTALGRAVSGAATGFAQGLSQPAEPLLLLK